MASGAAAGPGPEERQEPGSALPPSNGATPAPGPARSAPGPASSAPAARPEIRAVGSGVFTLWAVGFVAAVALGIVLIQNTHAVRFRFLWVDAEPPLFAVIIVTALLAAAVSEGVTEVWRHRRRRVRNERVELERFRRQPPRR